ncbi:uncharacterized protein LOC142219387 [Haematobia irritans]|uniref:uncharacterized protein LOC142219387 n=1 Tax=Haematobia irritans TaxID=7368 RepID=UPI003F505930
MAHRFGQFLAVLVAISAVAVADKSVAEPRIHSSEELLSSIVDNCFNANGMYCLKEKVLTYLDTVAGVDEDVSGRAFNDDVIDTVITDRVARILNTNEIRVQLPETLFASSVVTYRADRGFDLEIPQSEARDKKKNNNKLMLPLLLLLKLKMGVIMPIFMALLKLKVIKALILSKIAIKLVLGFLFYNLIQKLGGAKMSMTPVQTPSSYEPSSWEAPVGGPYARSDAHYMAYNSYHHPSSYSSSS